QRRAPELTPRRLQPVLWRAAGDSRSSLPSRGGRRFGSGGVRVLAALVCIGGVVRDFSVAAALPRMIRFGDARASVMADLGAWAIVVLVALVVTRVVAGPASADGLRGE